MPSAVDFLPSHIRPLMNLVTSGLLYTGSGSTSRLSTTLLLGISLWVLGPGCEVSGGGGRVRSPAPQTRNLTLPYFFPPLAPPLAAPAAAPPFGRLAPYFERPC